MVSNQCPEGFRRSGVRKCFRRCPEEYGFVGFGGLCQKPQSYQRNKSFGGKGECERGYQGKNCSLWAGEGYLEDCRAGFMPVGRDLCASICPEGWLDGGAHCEYEKVLTTKVFVKNFGGAPGKLAKPRFTAETIWKRKLSVKPRPKKANTDLENSFFYSQKNN
jgi:hypothetical protein